MFCHAHRFIVGRHGRCDDTMAWHCLVKNMLVSGLNLTSIPIPRPQHTCSCFGHLLDTCELCRLAKIMSPIVFINDCWHAKILELCRWEKSRWTGWHLDFIVKYTKRWQKAKTTITVELFKKTETWSEMLENRKCPKYLAKTSPSVDLIFY